MSVAVIFSITLGLLIWTNEDDITTRASECRTRGVFMISELTWTQSYEPVIIVDIQGLGSYTFAWTAVLEGQSWSFQAQMLSFERHL